jgi:OmpA-OmpF porin, OOP family
MKKMLLAAALVASCGVASAQGYVGALVGLSKIDLDCASIGATCDDSDTAFKVYGGYDLSPTVSIEVAYTNLGKLAVNGGGNSGTVKASAWSAAAAYRMPLMDSLTGVGRIGLSLLDAEASGVGGSSSQSETKLLLGAGLEYSLTKEFKLTGAIDFIDGTDAYIFGVGAQMGF